MFEELYHTIELVVVIISLIAVGIIFIGLITSIINFVRNTFKYRTVEDRLHAMQKNKIILGSYILLGLEMLIAADIIETIVEPGFEDLLLLLGIVLIRTVIAFFLNKEIAEDKKEIEEANHKKLIAQ